MSGKPRFVATLTPSESIPNDTDTTASNADAMASSTVESKNVLSNHKGKLAMGVAATLGIMVFYNWREKKLAKEDPENYARLQRLKTLVRSDATTTKKEKIEEKPPRGQSKIKVAADKSK